MDDQKLLTKINNKIKFVEDKIEKKLLGVKDNEIILRESLETHLPTINNMKNVKTLTDLHYLRIAIEDLYNTFKTIKEEEEYKYFLEKGESFDVEELRKKYEKLNLKKKFPNFDIERYLYLLNNPIKEIKNFGGEIVVFDSYWIKKNLVAINQMIFNEMDLYILNIGKEGSGKSCWSSQQILYFYTFLKEVGLINYEYDMTKMFFTDIETFLENHETQEKNDYFRIECLDEGNELNRSNFREETNQQFKYEMRTERKMQRIIIINMQQIGELDTSISLSRVNFIYNCQMKSNKKSGTLNKGFIDMFIIPRGNQIYSEKNKKVFSRQEILNTFAVKLDKKKDYYVSLPQSLVVKNFKFKNLWGFDKDEYDEHVKDKMRERRFQKKMKLTDQQAYILKTKLENFTKLGTFDRKNNPSDDKMYGVLFKFFKKIDNYFEANPEKLTVLRKHYTQNTENYIKE